MKFFLNALILTVSGFIVSFLSGNLALSVVTCLIVGTLLSAAIIKLTVKQKKKQPWFHSDEYINRFKEVKIINEKENREENSLNELLEDSIFLDQNNEVWSIGTDSLTWYRLEGTEWVNDIPKYKLRQQWRNGSA